MMLWMEDKYTELQTMYPSDQNAGILHQQIEEHTVCACVCMCVCICVCAHAYYSLSLPSSPFTLLSIFPSLLPHLSLIPQAFIHEATAKQPEYDTLLADGRNLLQLAHPKAVPVLQDKLHHLKWRWVNLHGQIGQPCHQAF